MKTGALIGRGATAEIFELDGGDVLKGNNHWTRADFGIKAPGLDWEAFFAAAGLNQPEVFVVWQPAAFTGLSALAAEGPLETWKDYLTFHAIQHRSRVLPKAVRDQSFSFYGKVLSGASKPRDRWKYGVDQTNDALGEVVGKAYVARYFPASEKVRAQKMVANILTAFRTRIEQLDWMSVETQTKALAKLATLKVGVGYPDRWQDYGDLKILAGDAFGNAERAEHFEYARNLRKLGQPIDRSEWVMTPQTVNAVNLPVMNALNFPAAILQPPYFDPKRPMVMDYGAIGAVIGHEISHSFDDSGSLFDASGKLNNWWTPDDLKHFQASADQLVKQYDAYQPFPGMHINGRQTLGENIADVAGLAAAYDAYRLSLHGRPAPLVQGFTGDQQFFISYAQSWREKSREPLLRQQILTDGPATMPLDKLEAYLGILNAEKKGATVAVRNEPPAFVFSPSPAVLITIHGDPIWTPVAGTALRRVLNTRPLVLSDERGTVFVHILDGWLQAPGLSGPWTVTPASPTGWRNTWPTKTC